MAIRKLIVTLETVTPMFLMGADNETPELRAPSVVGQLRYWLRAALGGVVGDDLEALKRAEAEVFGDNNGTGAVSVRLSYPKLDIDKNINPLPHKPKKFTFEGFKAGQKFNICLTQQGGDNTTWLVAISALLLMVSIGGLGRRCRRGWGTVNAIKFDTSASRLPQYLDLALTSAPLSVHTTLDFTHESLKIFYKTDNLTPTTAPTEYTVLSKDLMKIFICDNKPNFWKDPQDTIKSFGQIEHDCLKRNSLPSQSVGYVQPSRQASPLWLRVMQVGKAKFILLAFLFKVNFNGSDFDAVTHFLTNDANFKEVPR